jgi:hypothetical protein
LQGGVAKLGRDRNHCLSFFRPLQPRVDIEGLDLLLLNRGGVAERGGVEEILYSNKNDPIALDRIKSDQFKNNTDPGTGHVSCQNVSDARASSQPDRIILGERLLALLVRLDAENFGRIPGDI